MTFVLDAIHVAILEGFATVNETLLTIHVNNTTGRDIVLSKVSTVVDKIVTFPSVVIQSGQVLTINADAPHFGWNHGDTIHWWFDYSVDEPVFHIEKVIVPF